MNLLSKFRPLKGTAMNLVLQLNLLPLALAKGKASLKKVIDDE